MVDSFSDPIHPAADGAYPLEAVCRPCGGAENYDLKIDIARTVDRLGPEFSELADLLSEGETKSGAGRRLGISRSTTHRRVAALGVALREVGLETGERQSRREICG